MVALTPDKHLIFVSVAVLTGVVVGMQTRRARAIRELLKSSGRRV